MKRTLIAILALTYCISNNWLRINGLENTNKLYIATSAEYPPFEYYHKGELTGFDIKLGKLIAKELGYEANFLDMEFGNVLVAVNSNVADMAIATLSGSESRMKQFDFSNTYYSETLAILYYNNKAISNSAVPLDGKKIACQIGSAMCAWLKEHGKQSQIHIIDNNLKAIEELKAGYVDGVLLNEIQAKNFSQTNKNLSYTIVAKSKSGYSVVLKKQSLLTSKINDAIKNLNHKGLLEALYKKYQFNFTKVNDYGTAG